MREGEEGRGGGGGGVNMVRDVMHLKIYTWGGGEEGGGGKG